MNSLEAESGWNITTGGTRQTWTRLTNEEADSVEKKLPEPERPDASLLEARGVMLEREQFLEESETRLLEKVQAQQEKETELEQREEDLCTRSREFRERQTASGLLPAPPP